MLGILGNPKPDDSVCLSLYHCLPLGLSHSVCVCMCLSLYPTVAETLTANDPPVPIETSGCDSWMALQCTGSALNHTHTTARSLTVGPLCLERI